MRFSTSMSSWISNVLSKLNRYSNLEATVAVRKALSPARRLAWGPEPQTFPDTQPTDRRQ